MSEPLPMFWRELVCCECASSTSGGWSLPGSHVPVLQMLADAKLEGWRMLSDGDVACSKNCADAYCEKTGAEELP